MAPLEEYLKQADYLAQEIVNAWAINVQAGIGADLTDEFKGVFDRACRYRDSKSLADNHRECNFLSERDAAEESDTRQAFAEAYKTFWEKREAAA
jgi:hypothetical protein